MNLENLVKRASLICSGLFAALAVVTEWNEFRTPDFKKMKRLLNKPVVFDGRNIYSQAELRKMGFTYYGIGRR